MGNDIKLKTGDGKNYHYIAAIYGHLNLCKKLKDIYTFNLDLADNNGWAAHHFFATNGSYELVINFVDMFTDIHLRTKDGSNCLHIAACNRHLSLCKTLIIKHGLEVNMASNDRWTALYFSTRSGSYKLFP